MADTVNMDKYLQLTWKIVVEDEDNEYNYKHFRRQCTSWWGLGRLDEECYNRKVKTYLKNSLWDVMRTEKDLTRRQFVRQTLLERIDEEFS